MHIGYPYRIDGSGRTVAEGGDEHIRHLIEQVLFTMPGERVNRPDFGAGVMQLVFGAPNDELLSATQFLIQGSLLQWLGDLIEVNDVDVQENEGVLGITVRYTVRRTQQQQAAYFEH
jgi:uncharacterized protein